MNLGKSRRVWAPLKHSSLQVACRIFGTFTNTCKCLLDRSYLEHLSADEDFPFLLLEGLCGGLKCFPLLKQQAVPTSSKEAKIDTAGGSQ